MSEMTTGAEMRRMLELVREQEHPLPEVMEPEEMDLLPRVTKDTVLLRLRRRAVESLRKVRRRRPALGRFLRKPLPRQW